MAVIIPLPAGPHAEHRGLAFWMERVLKELECLRRRIDADAVHDLRVALRRCRSLAAAMEEVDAHPAWPAMRKAGRKLFDRLGTLRDVQVQEEWVKKLGPEGDPLRALLVERLKSRERSLRDNALRIAECFDEKKWRSLERILRRRARFVPPGSLAARCLVLERFEQAHELHRHALRTERAKPWHKLRIGVKRFRYTVEGLLPEHYAAWSGDLKRVQDLLGEVHDFDTLFTLVKENTNDHLAESRGRWEETIAQERHARIETYRRLTLGTTSLWKQWRLGLPSNGEIEAAAIARIQATARAADPHLSRTVQAARIALKILEAMQRAKIAPATVEPGVRRVLLAAGRLHGVRPEGFGRNAQKAARRFLASLPAPAGWPEEEWQLVALAVHYHRGGEPKTHRGPLAKVGGELQKKVFVLAGLLRLGRALGKMGLRSLRGVRAEDSADAIVFRVPGICDAQEAAAKLSSTTHLLERGLGRRVLVQAATISGKVLSLPIGSAREALSSCQTASQDAGSGPTCRPS